MFDDLWKFVEGNCKVLAQNKVEMKHVYDLILGCDSYLEIGTAEGNSLYIFGNAVNRGGRLAYVDLAEEHTKKYREGIIPLMKAYSLKGIHGNSHDSEIIKRAQEERYDCVFIDAGHKYKDALEDARNYAPLADKYVFFHDVQMPEVMEAFKMWQLESGMKGYTVINSENYGYGVIKV